MSRPPILMLSRNLPPLRGGMERLNRHIAEELASGFDLAVCGPQGCTAELPFASVVREAPLRPLSRFLTRNFIDALQLARRRKPRLILCGSGLTVPTALIASRLSGARVVAYLHGLDIVAEHAVYRALWRRSLKRVDLALVNSRHTQALAVGAGIPSGRVVVLNPGVALPRVRPGAVDEFRQRFDLGDRPLLLSIGRLTDRKGLAEFIELALPRVLQQQPRTLLVVIGEEATEALVSTGRGQKQRILDAAQRAGITPALRLLGGQPDEVVSAAFTTSAALVFPVLELPGDVEGFGMVAIEAAAHGTPTVAFAVGGVPDAVSQPLSSTLLPAGDYAGLAQALLYHLATPADAGLRQRRIDYASSFAWPLFGDRLRQLCRNLIADDATVSP